MEKWKNINKSLQTGKVDQEDLTLDSNEPFEGDVLEELSAFLNIRKSEIPDKVQKLLEEWKEGKQKLNEMQDLLSESNVEKLISNANSFDGYKLVLEQFDGLDQEDLKNLSVKVMNKAEDVITVFINQTPKGILLMGMEAVKPTKDSDLVMGNFIRECVTNFGGKGGGRKDFGQGFIGDPELDPSSVKEHVLKLLKI